MQTVRRRWRLSHTWEKSICYCYDIRIRTLVEWYLLRIEYQCVAVNDE